MAKHSVWVNWLQTKPYFIPPVAFLTDLCTLWCWSGWRHQLNGVAEGQAEMGTNHPHQEDLSSAQRGNWGVVGKPVSDKLWRVLMGEENQAHTQIHAYTTLTQIYHIKLHWTYPSTHTDKHTHAHNVGYLYTYPKNWPQCLPTHTQL